MNFKAGKKKCRAESRGATIDFGPQLPANKVRPRSEVAGPLLYGLHCADGDGAVFLASRNGGLRAGLLVERGQGGFVAGLQRVDLVAYDQGVLGSLRYAAARSRGVVAGHRMFGSAHGVADRSGVGLTSSSERGYRKTC